MTEVADRRYQKYLFYRLSHCNLIPKVKLYLNIHFKYFFYYAMKYWWMRLNLSTGIKRLFAILLWVANIEYQQRFAFTYLFIIYLMIIAILAVWLYLHGDFGMDSWTNRQQMLPYKHICVRIFTSKLNVSASWIDYWE